MNIKSTNTDKSVKVISDTRESELLTLMSHIHGKVMTALQEVGVEPKFNSNFSKCVAEDYKQLHHQMRILVSDKTQSRWNEYVSTIATGIQGIINTHMERARAAKAHMDALPEDVRKYLPAFSNSVKVPVSDLVGVFPASKTPDQIVAELDKLFPRNVGKGAEGQWFLSVAYKAAEKAPVEETAPISGEQAAAAE